MTKKAQQWIRLYNSSNETIRVRAAQGLLRRGSEVPLKILLEILDRLSDRGLGAQTERVLKQRTDAELIDEMIVRLNSKDSYVRETACAVLGATGSKKATLQLLRTLDDSHVMVRRAAAFALAALKDPASTDELTRQYEKRTDDDINVRMALECALDALGVSKRQHPY